MRLCHLKPTQGRCDALDLLQRVLGEEPESLGASPQIVTAIERLFAALRAELSAVPDAGLRLEATFNSENSALDVPPDAATDSVHSCQPPKVPRQVIVDEKRREVNLDGKCYELRNESVFLYVKAVVNANGVTIGQKAFSHLDDPRPSRWHSQLKRCASRIADAIEIKKGIGSRLKDEYRV